MSPNKFWCPLRLIPRTDGRQGGRGPDGGAPDAGLRHHQPERPAGALGDYPAAALEAVAAADLVTVLYNPRSKKRVKQLEEAVAIFARHRPATTPVGIGTAVGTEEEQIVLTDLSQVLEKEIGMRSLVIIGNRSSKKLLDWFITPRGYKV